jgi:hypothetical protein
LHVQQAKPNLPLDSAELAEAVQGQGRDGGMVQACGENSSKVDSAVYKKIQALKAKKVSTAMATHNYFECTT